jgi:hypothetical protein
LVTFHWSHSTIHCLNCRLSDLPTQCVFFIPTFVFCRTTEVDKGKHGSVPTNLKPHQLDPNHQLFLSHLYHSVHNFGFKLLKWTVSKIQRKFRVFTPKFRSFYFYPKLRFFYPKFRAKMLWNGCRPEVSGEITETSRQQSGIFGYRNF